jgi:hypothetical protein
MYVDGHKREDVVQYRNAFVQCFKQYEQHFHLWDDDGKDVTILTGMTLDSAVMTTRAEMYH